MVSPPINLKFCILGIKSYINVQILTKEKYKGDDLLRKTYIVDFLNKKREDNTG